MTARRLGIAGVGATSAGGWGGWRAALAGHPALNFGPAPSRRPIPGPGREVRTMPCCLSGDWDVSSPDLPGEPGFAGTAHPAFREPLQLQRPGSFIPCRPVVQGPFGRLGWRKPAIPLPRLWSARPPKAAHVSLRDEVSQEFVPRSRESRPRAREFHPRARVVHPRLRVPA
jgi:hypothetical protein